MLWILGKQQWIHSSSSSRLPNNWTKWQKPAKYQIQKFVKSIDHTYAWNSLTNFEYVVQAMTENGNCLNMKSFAGKTYETTFVVLIFSRFQPFGTLCVPARRTRHQLILNTEPSIYYPLLLHMPMVVAVNIRVKKRFVLLDH